MKKIFLLAFLCFGILGCGKVMSQVNSAPICINQKMLENVLESGDIAEYIYHGQTVFVFSSSRQIADGGSNVFDAQCNQICWLGGISGDGDGKCPDFDKAKLIKNCRRRSNSANVITQSTMIKIRRPKLFQKYATVGH